MATLRPPLAWQAHYANKLVPAAEAVRKIPPGTRLLIGSGAAEPITLVQALVEHGGHLADNEIVHLLTLGPAPYVAPEYASRFRHTAFFVGANTRAAVRDGRADFMPVFLSEIPELIRSRRVRIDVVLIQVAPPDHHGQCSLGVSVDIVRAAVDAADYVIAEVNPNMPRTHGDSFVDAHRIDAMVDVQTPLLELKTSAPDEISAEIGRRVASLIPSGATLQTGIGKIPHAVMQALSNHHDLGVHTEMLSDSVIDLVEAGVINGKKKTLLPGKLVTSFIMGTQRLYTWVDDNPRVEMRPSNFTNSPSSVARNDSMISINSALAVDLTGQVAADGVRGQFFSGIGGQVDFIRGAAQSRGGKPIIAFPSTAERGRTSRGDVHYVVTEYGIADLWGKNVRERAMALTSISHPDFRRELLDAAKERHYVFPDQPIPHGPHPGDETLDVLLKDGRKVALRPARITDERALQELFYRLSSESIYQRFLHFKTTHPHEEMQTLVNPDIESAQALVASAAGDETSTLVAMARYDVDPATQTADVAFVVDDNWQANGLGTALLARLAKMARARGLVGFTADVLSSNKAMLGVFLASALRNESERDGDLTRVVLHL